MGYSIDKGETGPESGKKPVNYGFLKKILIHVVIWYCLVVLAFLSVPTEVVPAVLNIPKPPELVGVLKPNYVLNQGEKIYEGFLHGPESMVIDGEHIYTAGFDGYVTDLYKGTARRIVRFGKGICGDIYAENTCGRPLGMRMDKDGYLLVLDTYYGLFRVDTVTGEYTTLYNSSTPVEGQTAKLLNDLDIAADGKIYFTDSHDKFPRNKFWSAIMEMRPSGRLLVYDPKTGKVQKLLDNLIFPNGVQMTVDQKAVLVCETMAFRISKYDLKTKEVTIWAENLPGNLDNIRYSATTGTYWLGLQMIRHKNKPSMVDSFGNSPGIRKNIMGRISMDINMVIEEIFHKSVMDHCIVAEFDHEGNIIRSLHDPHGDVVYLASEVHVNGDILILSSVYHNYLVKLNLTQVIGSVHNRDNL